MTYSKYIRESIVAIAILLVVSFGYTVVLSVLFKFGLQVVDGGKVQWSCPGAKVGNFLLPTIQVINCLLMADY